MGRTWAIIFGLVACASLALGATPTSEPAALPTTLPMPTIQAVSVAMRQVRELQEKRGLDAQGLLTLSLGTTSSPALRYAAAMRAMELAADAGKVNVGLEAINELGARYGEDELETGAAFVKRLAKASQNEAAAVLGCRYLDRALTAERRNVAAELNAIIAGVRPALDPQMVAFSDEAIADYRRACEMLPGRSATSAPSSNAQYACLYQDRWESSLPDLALGKGELSLIAQEDIAAKELGAQMLVAERWWRAAQMAGGRTGWRIARRACAIYRAAIPQVDGVQKALITSRLGEHQRQAVIHNGMLSGVIREVWKEGDTRRNAQHATIIDLPRDAKIAGMPRSSAHVRYTGQLFIAQPGRYELVCIAGSGLRMEIDGKELVNNPKAYSKRNGEKLALNLAAGLHPIEIEVWAASSQPRLDVQWMPPGSTQKQPIPASALYHDPLAR